MHLTDGVEERGKIIYNLGYSGEFITPVRRCSVASGEGRRRGRPDPESTLIFWRRACLPTKRASDGTNEEGRKIIMPVAFACGQGQIIAM